MRPLLIVFAFPDAGEGLRFPEAREALGVQELVSEPRLEGFGVSVLPGSAGFEVERPPPARESQALMALAMNLAGC